ncbi:RNA polymerase sigma factor [Novosphingobium terrae]|uniref:RNA polymerase sigma factor n=1 Tax=Novosphingobium terrae TaxID=2726189 RepID=UPI00197F9BCD|nr:sigma-70 family RNA polymerase sigma factor [Novosphingobium terrae]
MSVATASPEIIRWVATHVVPQEGSVRASLRRLGVSQSDADDIIQDAYCRFASLTSVAHIDRPGAYFMQTVKNLWRDHLRRAQIIRFEDFTENASSFVEAEAMGIEEACAARQQLRMVEAMLARLPERCRTIFTLKRVEGLSQKEIAARLGVSESVVENDVQKALRLIQAEMRATACLPGEDTGPAQEHGHLLDRQRRNFVING